MPVPFFDFAFAANCGKLGTDAHSSNLRSLNACTSRPIRERFGSPEERRNGPRVAELDDPEPALAAAILTSL